MKAFEYMVSILIGYGAKALTEDALSRNGDLASAHLEDDGKSK